MLRKTFVLGVVLALAIAVGASAASSGLYTGKTSQQLKITLKVSGGKVVNVTYTAKYGSCGQFSEVDKAPMSIQGNKFRKTVRPNSEVVDKLSGTFNGKNVTGKLSSTLMTGGIHPTTCRSGSLTFSAKR